MCCVDEVCVGCAVWMRFVWGVLCGCEDERYVKCCL